VHNYNCYSFVYHIFPFFFLDEKEPTLPAGLTAGGSQAGNAHTPARRSPE